MKQISIGENHLYSKAYSRGRKKVGRYTMVYILPDYKAKMYQKRNPAKQYINRVGITVGKKIGGAVIRSRTKRIIREAYRLCEAHGNLKHGFLIVIVARERAADAKMQDIYTDLRRALPAEKPQCAADGEKRCIRKNQCAGDDGKSSAFSGHEDV